MSKEEEMRLCGAASIGGIVLEEPSLYWLRDFIVRGEDESEEDASTVYAPSEIEAAEEYAQECIDADPEDFKNFIVVVEKKTGKRSLVEMEAQMVINGYLREEK